MAAIITFMPLMVCFMISFCCHGLFLIILTVRVSFFFSGELMELVLCTPGKIGGRLIQTAWRQCGCVSDRLDDSRHRHATAKDRSTTRSVDWPCSLTLFFDGRKGYDFELSMFGTHRWVVPSRVCFD